MSARFTRTAAALLFSLLVLLPAAARAQAGSVILRDASNVQLSTHASIQAAYNAIPATVAQAYTVEISAAYTGANEVKPITLGPKSGASATNTLTVRPAPGVSVAITANTNLTSAFVLDGADWVVLDASSGSMAVTSTAPNPIQPLLDLRNGATNNLLRGLALMGISAGSTADGIRIGTSTAVLGGNSGNRIERCSGMALREAVRMEAPVGAPATLLTVQGNDFRSVGIAGIHVVGGLNALRADSNYIRLRGNVNGPSAGIWVEDIRDTVRITRNRVLLEPFSMSPSSTGILVTTPATNPGARALLYNNYVGVAFTPVTTSAAPSSLFPSDSLSLVTGIEIGAGGALTSRLLHNTVVVRGGQLFSATATELSAALRIAGNNPNSSHTALGNILLNERTGPVPTARHTALSLQNAGGTLTLDYNTYGSNSGTVATIGGTPYSTLGAYQAAVPGNDANSNTVAVPFDGPDDARLAASAIGSAPLTVPVQAEVPTDYEGEPRTVAYRGADEVTLSCANVPGAGTVTAMQASPLCSAGNAYLIYTPAQPRGGAVRQWQSRPLGSTGAWTNVVGGTSSILLTAVTGSTEFRLRDSCAAGGPAVVSNTDTVIVTPLPDISAIGRTASGTDGRTITFTATVAGAPQNWRWDFGDGDTALTGPTVTHTYGADGVYTARVIATNICGSDTAFVQFVVGLNIGVGGPGATATGVRVAPNPVAGRAFWVEGPAPISNLRLVDLQGRTTAAWNGAGRRVDAVLPAHVAPGVYWLRVGMDGGAVETLPLVVR